jgi:mannitol/fructose-specific phosphotransferase system IIA component (Ntr-type)
MNICQMLKENHIFLDLKSGDKAKVLQEFVSRLKGRGLIDDEKKILKELLERERLCSTGLEKGIAVPHSLTDQVKEPLLALAVVRDGMVYESVDQMPTFILLLILGNKENPGVQLKILAHVCRLVKETDFVEKVKNAEAAKDVCAILDEEEGKIG